MDHKIQALLGYSITTSDILDLKEKPACGHVLGSGFKFCPECGEKISTKYHSKLKDEFKVFFLDKPDDMAYSPLWWTTKEFNGYSVFRLDDAENRSDIYAEHVVGIKIGEIDSTYNETIAEISFDAIIDVCNSMQKRLEICSFFKERRPNFFMRKYSIY